MKVFDGKRESQRILNDLKRKIKKEKLKPGLAVFLIGKNKSSELYVKLKKKVAEEIGIEFNLFKYSQSAKQEEVIKKIKELNKDDLVNGIIVQLPLLKGFNANEMISNIDPKKDADGFHKKNLIALKSRSLGKGQTFWVAPVLPKVIFEIFKHSKKNRQGQFLTIRALVRSKIFGDTLKAYFKLNGFKLEFLIFPAFPRTVLGKSGFEKLEKFTQRADVLISVLGIANFIKVDMVKDGVVLIDAGVSKKGKKVIGDVDQKGVSQKATFITPVPGGVGPMTVAMLLENVYLVSKSKFTDII